MGTFGFHGLILYVSEGLIFELLCVHNVGIDTSFDLHELILRVPEGVFSLLLCIHIVGMGTFDPHGLILSVSEDFFYKML